MSVICRYQLLQTVIMEFTELSLSIKDQFFIIIEIDVKTN